MSGMPEKDIIDKYFFQNDACTPDLYEESWEFMRENKVKIYESLDTIPFREFPPIATRTHLSGGRSTIIAPKKEWNSILIPYAPDLHDERYFKDHLISDLLFPLLGGNSGKKKYIASVRSWYGLFAEMDNFEYEIFNQIVGMNMVIPFILFDETLSYCFGFDFDFEYSFFSSANLKHDDARLKGTFAEWDQFFVDEFVKKPPNTYSYHQELFETVLRPSIPRKFNFP